MIVGDICPGTFGRDLFGMFVNSPLVYEKAWIHIELATLNVWEQQGNMWTGWVYDCSMILIPDHGIMFGLYMVPGGRLMGAPK